MNRVQWSEVTAIFGGTFDPPHLGHLQAALELVSHPGVRQVLILPSRNPPLKDTLTSFEDRFEMTRILFEEASQSFPVEVKDPYFFARLEQDYTFLLLQEVQKHIPKTAFVIGADQLELLPKWYRFPDVLKQTHWIVLTRKPHGEEIASHHLQQWVLSGLLSPAGPQNEYVIESSIGPKKMLKIVPTQAPALASSDIRKAIALHGQPPEKALSAGVLNYLIEKSLYGSRKEIQ